MEQSKQVLIVALLDNNHLSNVRTLQSIYRQSYNNIVLAICNDAISAFQSERFFYNLMSSRPQGIQKVFFLENDHPKGSVAVVRDVLGRFYADYVFVIHAGDLFCAPETVASIVSTFENIPQADALSVLSETWSDDFNTKLQTLSLPFGNDDFTNPKGTFSYAPESLQDCMLIYRWDALHHTLMTASYSTTVIQTALADMPLRGCTIAAASVPVCRHSSDTLHKFETGKPFSCDSNTDPVPSHRSAKDASSLSATSRLVKELPAPLPSQSTRHKRNKLLFHLSTTKKNVAYLLFALLLLNCSLLCFLLKSQISIAFGVLFSVLAFLACLWSVCMIGFHVYFKIKPERLIANDV